MNNWTIRGKLTSDGAFRSPATASIAGAVATVLMLAVVLLVLAGNPAQAQTCPDADDPPTPTEVTVTAVPIVVESTTADYFALYASHDVNGATVEYPVQVKLGEEGATTLAENVAPLPVERYRVEKYLVAEPADVDGDCTDDITELNDLGRMNPVNPGVTVELSNGAVAIPDQETFETLGNRFRVISVKFTIFDIDSDRPSVYFQDTTKFVAHGYFLSAIGLGRRPDFRGTVVYDPEIVAPDGGRGVYRYTIYTVRFQPEFYRFMEPIHTLLAARMPLLDDNLVLWMRGQTPAAVQVGLPGYEASRMNVLFNEDVFGATHFTILNPGEGYGLLRQMGPDERPNSRDVVIYGALPNELPRVAGIISTVPQTPLSHVNLRAVQDGVPNAFIAGALEDDKFSGLIGRHVHYKVTESGYSIRAADQSEVDEHHASSRPAGAQTPQRNLNVTELTALSEIGFDDWDSFGVKAANVAVLGTLGFPDGTVPDGFAVPFYFYDEFMKHNELYDDVREMLADPDFQADYDTKASELKKLRKKIKKAETPEWIDTALTDMHTEFPEGTSLRYRSSTNNEDLPRFSGAGLYDSKTQHPEETGEDGISKSLKQVYASLWNFRAFIERDFHRVDHLATAMGVLVHPNYSDELVNGVAVSTDPAYGTEGTYYINSQIGEDLVTNPDAHSAPEEVLLDSDGTYAVVALSNQVPAGQLLMTDNQLGQLRRHLAVVHDKFAELYGVEDGGEFAMEIEFKITSDDVLGIKQARPWIFPPLTGRFAAAPANHDGSSAFSVRLRFNNGIAISDQEFRDHAVTVTGGRVTNARRVGDRGELWEIEVTPESGADVKIVLASDRPCTVVGTICTDRGRRLSTRLEHTVEGPIPPVPDPPTGTALWASIVDLEWNEVPGADSYDVQVFHTGQWTELPANGIEIAFYGAGAVIRDLLTDVDYNFRVRAVDSHGASEWSDHSVLPKTGGREAWTGVPEPANAAATGAPAISGTLRMHETLTADVSGIADENGLDRVKFHYQWTRSDGTDDTDIEGETSAYYTLTTADCGSALGARVSFVDRQGFAESLMGGPVEVVAGHANSAAGDSPTIGLQDWPHGLTAIALDGAVVLTWKPPVGQSDVYDYRILRNRPELCEPEPLVYVEYTNSEETAYTDTDVEPGVLYVYRVKASDIFGRLGHASEPVEIRTEGSTPAENAPAIGAPTIAGTARVGETLTADTSGISDADGLVTARFTYQWLTDDTDIEEATDSTYTLTDSDEGKAIKVRVSFTDDAGNEESLTSAPIAPDRPYGLTTAVSDGAVVLTWKPPVGQSYMFDYRILRNRPELGEAEPLVHVEYTETDETTFTDTDVEPGVLYVYRVKAVVDVFGRLGEASEPVEIRTAEPTPGENSPATGAPTISGAAQVGETLTADTSGIADADGLDNVSFTYQWVADDVEINGADGSSYTLADSDAGKAIKVRVSFSDDEGNEETLTSAATRAVAAEPAPLTAQFLDTPPSHDGQTAFTFELRLSEEFELSYVTLRDHAFTVTGGAVAGARRLDPTGNTRWEITVRPDGDGEVTVVLPATEDCEDQGAICTGDGRPLSNRTELTVQVPTPANAAATGAPTITGTPQVGQTLTVDTSGIADSDGLDNVSFTYQWLADDADISGATDSSYTLVSDDEGKTVRVRVSFSDDLGNPETLTSAATAAVEPAPNSPATGAPTITGTPQVGQTLTVDTSGIADSDGLDNVSFTYQWLADDADISGATDSSYTLVSDDEGKTVRVRVSFSDDLGNPETLTSAATAAVEPAPNSPATGAPTIGGTAQVGETLTADTSGIADGDGLDNVSFSYQWVADDTEIAGAAGSSYTLTNSDEGKAIKVRVSFTDDGGNEETLTSEATDAVEARPNSPATGAPTISGTVQVGETLTADTTGIEDDDGLDDATFSFQWVADDADIAGATGSSYTITDSDEGKAIKVRVSFTDDEGNEETLTSAATSAVAAAPTPLTAEFLDTPESHDGQAAFTLELRFSEEFELSYKTLRDHAFTVTGGEVTGARRLEKPGNIRWEISVSSDGDGNVTIVLPVTVDCNDQGAICAQDGRRLSAEVTLTVAGPGE